jgi:hypothetical protein
MNNHISCKDRERIFMDGSAEEWVALESHATNCQECAEEVRAWKAISRSAEELRDYKEDAALWVKIESSLRRNEERRSIRQAFWEKVAFWHAVPVGWQAALVGALVLVLAVSAGYIYVNRGAAPVPSDKLLKNSALAEVERTEHDYMKAIDKLAVDAKPQLDSEQSPLMASYREKLMVLDSAIDELRLEAGKNPSNAHLRYELLAMYQEKQETLREVLETKR